MKKILQSIFRLPLLQQFLLFVLEKFPSSSFAALATPNYEYPPKTYRSCRRYGINYRLDISDYQNWVLYFYSKADSSFGVLPYINKGDIIFDIGGNIGQTAMMMAKQAGQDGYVYSFEPFPATYNNFEYNLELNPSIKNISPVKIAFGSVPGSLQMYADCETNSGANRMLPGSLQAENTETVPVTSIDKFMGENAISRLDFIKIDVEGFEMEVLKGAYATLKKYKPRLFVELDDANLKNQGSSAAGVCSYLAELGYTIFIEGTQKKFYPEFYTTPVNIYCSSN